jgi:beta-N-acetylhexosaminidase
MAAYGHTQGNLPLSRASHPRIRLYGISGSADCTGVDPNVAIAQQPLAAADFEVHVFKNAQQRIAEGEHGAYFYTATADDTNSGKTPRRTDSPVGGASHLDSGRTGAR